MEDNFFIEYRDDVIEDFQVNCVACGALEKIGDFSDEQIDLILENFSEHEECYKHKHEFDEEGIDIFASRFDEEDNCAVIECMHCDYVIIHSDTLKEK